jgi:hypothetical protein
MRTLQQMKVVAPSSFLWWTLLVLLLAPGCGGRTARGSGPTARPASTVQVGDCADPGRDGVIGANPALRHADRDLDGDAAPEVVVADRTLCTREGNCHWNVFVGNGEGGCRRYAGTIDAASIESLPGRGEAGYADLRGFWQLTGGGRFLVQEYRFRRGGYQVVDALLCRQEQDDRVRCSEAPTPGAQPANRPGS